MCRFFKAGAIVVLYCIAMGHLSKAFAAPADTSVTEKPALYIGLKFTGGYTFSPYERVRILEAHTAGFELLISKATFGERTWEQIHSYPRIGLAFEYINLGKPQLTGEVFALLPNIQWSLIKNQSTEASLRLGAGTGYFNTIFNPVTNYKNKAISTHFNVAIQLNAIVSKQISKCIEINGGIGFIHFSNGALKLPNNGINIPNIYLGANYIINRPESFPPLAPETVSTVKKNYLNAFAAISSEIRGYYGEQHYAIYSFAAVYGKRVSRRSKLGIGMDLFIDRTLPTDSVGRVAPAKSFKDIIEAGLKIEHELVIGKMGIITSAGRYVYNISGINGPWYQVLGIKYNLTSHLFIGAMLKTHFANADFTQYALGVTF